MTFVLGKTSLGRLIGVHPDLVKVVKRAIEVTEHDFSVIEGVRTREKQAAYLASGASTTMDSRHIPGADGLAKAVDLYPVGKPTPWAKCPAIKEAMFKAAKELGVSIRWGGDWDMDGDSKDESFYDGPHFELLRSKYP